jgi:hypothetical protein
MKRLLLIAVVLFLINGFAFGQNLKKGNLIGTHALTIELNPGITMEKFQDFYINKYLPEFEKHFPGWTFYMTKGIRGENENTYGWIAVIESEETRAKYLDDDGIKESIAKKLEPINEEFNKYR